MSKKGAQKTGSGDPGGKRKNSEMAAYMAKHGIRRTTMRDPVTYRMVGIKATGSANGKIIG